MCSYVIIEQNNKDLEYRRIIMQSIDNALKKGDEVLSKLVSDTNDPCMHINYKKFKESLSKINHENLKK